MSLSMKWDVYVWHPNGEVIQISPDGGDYFQPCIHPDGTEVVFAGNITGPPRIWRSSTSGDTVSAITPEDSGATQAVYSSDGSMLAFMSDRDSGEPSTTVEELDQTRAPKYGNIFLMDMGSDEVRKLTEGPFLDERPCFSPDGLMIVFVSWRIGGPTLWSVPTDGSAPPEKFPYQGFVYRPWFSVDGEWIFFMGVPIIRRQIWRVRPSGEDLGPMINDDQGFSHGPFADPGGEVLLMHSTRGQNHYSIWELPLDGSPPRSLIPPGFEGPTHGNLGHATRSRDGTIAFDNEKIHV